MKIVIMVLAFVCVCFCLTPNVFAQEMEIPIFKDNFQRIRILKANNHKTIAEAAELFHRQSDICYILPWNMSRGDGAIPKLVDKKVINKWATITLNYQMPQDRKVMCSLNFLLVKNDKDWQVIKVTGDATSALSPAQAEEFKTIPKEVLSQLGWKK